MTDWLEVFVDKAEFLSVIRVMRKMFPGEIPDLRLTVEAGSVRFEFPEGGSVLKCRSKHVIVAHIPGKTIRRIVTAHGIEKQPNGEMALIFRPKLQVFATPLAGGTANIASIRGRTG